MEKKNKTKIRISISITEEEKVRLQKKANKHTDGNLSAYLILAGIKFSKK